jgi:hypothetical protein
MQAISDGIIISIIWFIAIYTLKNQNKKNIISREEQSDCESKFNLFSHLLVLSVLIADIGLLIKNDSFIFNTLMDVYRIPIISMLLFMINIYIIYRGTRRIIKEVLIVEGDFVDSKIKVVSFVSGLFVLSITFVMFFIHCVFWGEFSYVYANDGASQRVYDLVIGVVFILIPAVIIFINGILYAKHERIGRHVLWVTFPIVLFMGLTQTMITKLIVLYNIAIQIIKAVKESKNHKNRQEDYELLLFASTYIHGRKMATINIFYFLSFFTTVFLFWGIQTSPYPPVHTSYLRGGDISMFFFLGILAFVILEALGRRFHKIGQLIRGLFIPLMIFLTVFPFYTDAALLGEYGNNSQIISIYHILSAAFGSSHYMLFIFIIAFQGAIAYMLYIISGAMIQSKHYSAAIPIVGIVQLLIFILLYPLLITRPPYFLQANKIMIIGGLFIISGLVTYLVGRVAYYLFVSDKSGWVYYVSDYWKNKKRVYVIVGCISLVMFFALAMRTLYPIKNIAVKDSWKSQIASEELEGYSIDFIFPDANEEGFGCVAHSSDGKTKVIFTGYEKQDTLWDMSFKWGYSDYKLMDNNMMIMLKPDNTGFTIINITRGIIDYEYTIRNTEELEFLNIEVNARSVLVTEGLTQFVYDIYLGDLEVTNLGNNFYELVDGNRCALIKNQNLYLYQNNRWEKQIINSYIKTAEAIYYDDTCMIAFMENEMVKLSAVTPFEYVMKLPISYDSIILQEGSICTKSNNQLTFLIREQGDVYAYIVNPSDFTYKIALLEQKIITDHDTQSIKALDEFGNYLLYDDYQVTLYNNANILARQWYDLLESNRELESSSETSYLAPLVRGDSLILVEENGDYYAVNYN